MGISTRHDESGTVQPSDDSAEENNEGDTEVGGNLADLETVKSPSETPVIEMSLMGSWRDVFGRVEQRVRPGLTADSSPP
jgi:hypothetical protein